LKTVRNALKREEVRSRLEEIGIIPALRTSSVEDALFAAETLASAGIPILEVTMTVPGAIKVVHDLAHKNPEMIVGADVLDIGTAQRCLDAGASFLTCPGLDLEIVEFAHRREVVIFPGVLTPTEIIHARKAGADLVKIFPCAQVGGPGYIKALKAPFPDMRLIASGGVTQNTAAEFIQAGAMALGVGKNLIQPEAIHKREGDWIRELARRFLKMVRDARSHK